MRVIISQFRLPAAGVLAALAAVLLLPGAPALRAATKEVPTETIIVPDSGDDAAMPDVPADATEPIDDAGDTGDALEGDAEPAPPAADQPVPIVEYGDAKLPEPVKRLREQIIAAAKTGDPEKLRIIIDAQDPPPAFPPGVANDLIGYIKAASGDEGGREILAVLIEVLEAGYVHVDVGTTSEVYLWPYFAAYPVDKLTPEQLVELFKLVYAGDYEDMKTYQNYLYYRVGITPNGTWRYFIAD